MSGSGFSLGFPPELVGAIADAVAKRMADSPRDAEPDRWLTVREAGEHLGLSVNAIHKLTAARTIPFSQDVEGGRCFFKRSQLDRWRESRAEGPWL